jgi:hypothetical protein
MLKIIEVKSEQHFKQLRNIENSNNDYLYLLKYCSQIKMSDNGSIRNFSGVFFCETEEEYDNIENKEDILYIVGNKVYFKDTLISGEQYTDDDVTKAINEALKELGE